MKSIPNEVMQSNNTKLEKIFKEQLKRQLVIGMSYGAKATAQTIKDMIDNHVKGLQNITFLSNEQKDELLNAVIHFINTTVSSDTTEIAKVISNKIDAEE